MAYMWRWFVELQSGRRYGADGPVPLSWVDLMAWRAMSGTELRPQEAHALLRIDRVFLYPDETEGADSEDGDG